MKKTLSLLMIIFFAIRDTHAQSHKVKFAIGPEVSVPTYSGISSIGIGGGTYLEYFLNKKLAVTGDISFNYFKGNIFDFFKNDTINGFSIMPVLAGGKYFFTDKFYAAASAGLIIGLRNAGNHLALSPGAGIVIPFSETSAIDIGVKLIGVPRGYSFSENSFLNKGGYSFLTFRIAYVF